MMWPVQLITKILKLSVTGFELWGYKIYLGSCCVGSLKILRIGRSFFSFYSISVVCVYSQKCCLSLRIFWLSGLVHGYFVVGSMWNEVNGYFNILVTSKFQKNRVIYQPEKLEFSLKLCDSISIGIQWLLHSGGNVGFSIGVVSEFVLNWMT